MLKVRNPNYPDTFEGFSDNQGDIDYYNALNDDDEYGTMYYVRAPGALKIGDIFNAKIIGKFGYVTQYEATEAYSDNEVIILRVKRKNQE